MYLAAVFSNGHVATGRHHGEAFGRLSSDDQSADLVSGHVNEDGTFTTELDHIHKEIVLIRHAESMWNVGLTDDLDSRLTMKGVNQAQVLASFLRKNLDCRGFAGFSSPLLRCVLTQLPIYKQTGIRFVVRSEIFEITKDFPEEGVRVPCRSRQFLDVGWDNYCDSTFCREPSQVFLGRLRSFLDVIPDRSMIITHGSVVQTMIEMILGVRVCQIPTWDDSIRNASVTYIKDGTVVWLAKNAA
jgi:broad specificity phosphatase PhoE